MARAAIADGYDTCAVTSVPAADVEGAVLDQAGGRGRDHRARGHDPPGWAELFPAEQARIVQLLVERVDVHEDALEVRIRTEGVASAELRQESERMAA